MALRFVTSPYTEPSGDFFRPALINPTGGTATGRSFTINVTTQARIVPGTPVLFELSGFTGFAVSEVTSPITADDPAWHDLFIYYDFDDPGLFTAPLQTPNEWKNRNIAQGKNAVYAWPAAGTYTVTVLVIDRNGNWARETTTVTVATLQATYPGTRTILVDPDNIGDNTTYPSSQVVTSVAAAVSRLTSLAPTTGCILLRRGQTYNMTSTETLDDPLVNWHMDAFGTGAKPVLTRSRVNAAGSGYNSFFYGNANNITDSVWANLRFEGTWNPEKEIGDGRWTPFSVATHNRSGWKLGIFRCEFDGISAIRPWCGDNIEMHSFLIDTHITNFQDYGVHCSSGTGVAYDQRKKLGIVGCAIHQGQKTCANQVAKNDTYFRAWHGPLRYVDAMTFILHASSFYSHNSWGAGTQPDLRLAQTGNGTETGGYKINAHRFVCLSGSGWGPGGQNDDASARPGNHLFDSFITFNSNLANREAINCGFGGTTYRNALVVRLDYPRTGVWSEVLKLWGTNATDGNSTSRMDVHNITFINRTDDVVSTLTGTEFYTNYNLDNIVRHEPEIPSIADAPIDITTQFPEITYLSQGQRLGHNKDSFAITTTASGATLTVSYPPGLTRADVIEAGFHGIQIGAVGGSYYFNDTDGVTFTFTDTQVQIANNTGGSWSGSARLALECTDAFLDVAGTSAPSLTTPIGRQQAGSPAIDSASGLKSYADAFGNIRGTTWDRGFWEGVA